MLLRVFETFAGALAMMSFGALVQPIARARQAGATVTGGGIAWVLLARAWAVASDHHGRRRILLRELGGSAVSYLALCLFVVLALRGLPSAGLVFVGVAGTLGAAEAWA